MVARISLTATDDDVLRISAENPGWKVERNAQGQISMAPPAGGASSVRNALLTKLVVDWASQHDYVAFDSSGGFRLQDGSIVSPDAALLRRPVWIALADRERFVPMAPHVAIELVSFTDDPAELRHKLLMLRQHGTSYVVLIDPYRKSVWTDGTPPAGFEPDFSAVLAA